MTQNRWIELDGVVNMRDLGGLPTLTGGQVQRRRLIRSDNLQDLSGDDVRHVIEILGVSDILDLRTETEVHVEGPGPLWAVESLRHHHHSLVGNQLFKAADALALREHTESLAPGRDAAFWTNHYLGYLTDRGAAVSAALSVIATSGGATIVHCAAGKDRTGTVVALALDVAGVAHHDIVADYALSAQRLPQIFARLRTSELYGAALSRQTLADQETHPETMAAMLKVMTDSFGGTPGWLRGQGWSAGDVDSLRHRLTAPGS